MTHSFSRLDLCEDTTYVYIISRHIRSIQHIRRATEYRIVYVSSLFIYEYFVLHITIWMDGRRDGQTDR